MLILKQPNININIYKNQKEITLTMLLSDPITCIKSIGKINAGRFSKLNVSSIDDLLHYFPREYDDRSNITSIGDIKLEQVYTIKATVISYPEVIQAKNIKITKIIVSDNTGILEVAFFNQEYLKNIFKKDSTYLFSGKITNKFNKLQIQNPEYEFLYKANSSNNNLVNAGIIVPVYRSTYGLTQSTIRNTIKTALSFASNQITEFLPESFLREYKLCSRQFAITNIHFPENSRAFLIARRRLVFEEFLLLQLNLLQIKGSTRQQKSSVEILDFNTNLIEATLPFDLTDAQKHVLAEIKQDLLLDKPMNRLIQGDVGSGKTAIAQILAYMTINNNYQVAIMAPTEVLAQQHFESFTNLFNNLNLNINIILLSGSLKASQKNQAYSLIESGEANIIIGTHAIIQDKVIFNKLGLVITDEQHRFGVKQREQLSLKGENPHTLVMTATPIPRTLALILYGDLDISIINQMPPNRQSIHTSYVNTSYYARIYNFLKKNADQKNQAYIICPTIGLDSPETQEDSTTNKTKSDLKSVLDYTQKLQSEIFIDYRVECLHGKMKNDLKLSIMQDFYEGKIDILVSTTVIEVGINVPNATIMLIENAERFGISQLHQLRGRVGRGSEKSYCILVSDTKNKDTVIRLKNMVKYSDGFVLSEKDLETRGGGDFFGTRQHGVPEFKIGNLYKDLDLLKEVQDASIKIFREDPFLKNPDYLLLKQKINSSLNNINNTSKIL
ncbi:MAG: ATP-dependent DNA helicase RecG [bacterium]